MSVAELAAEEPSQGSGSGMGPRHSRMQYVLHIAIFALLAFCRVGLVHERACNVLLCPSETVEGGKVTAKLGSFRCSQSP